MLEPHGRVEWGKKAPGKTLLTIAGIFLLLRGALSILIGIGGGGFITIALGMFNLVLGIMALKYGSNLNKAGILTVLGIINLTLEGISTIFLLSLGLLSLPLVLSLFVPILFMVGAYKNKVASSELDLNVLAKLSRRNIEIETEAKTCPQCNKKRLHSNDKCGFCGCTID